jgi:hypothetical protein
VADERYFIVAGDREKGPYTVDQLREAVEQTAISDKAEVRLDGQEQTEPLSALLRRTEPEHFAKKRRGRQIAGVDVDIPDSPESERTRRAREGDANVGFVLGFFGGLIALLFSFMVKPKTRQGIVMGFVVQLGVGLALRLFLMAGD